MLSSIRLFTGYGLKLLPQSPRFGSSPVLNAGAGASGPFPPLQDRNHHDPRPRFTPGLCPFSHKSHGFSSPSMQHKSKAHPESANSMGFVPKKPFDGRAKAQHPLAGPVCCGKGTGQQPNLPQVLLWGGDGEHQSPVGSLFPTPNARPQLCRTEK